MAFFDSYPIPDSLKKPIQQLFTSLKKHPLRLLLALSGGPDSTALLHVLLAFQKERQFKLGVAHVDHRWRLESAAEARSLQQKLALAQIPLFLKVLDPQGMCGNLEQTCRLARLQFFTQICQEEGYDVVLMAHHKDDQAETVLKRVLEGAPIQGLSAMEEITQMGGILIGRPWLGVPKKWINDFLNTNKIDFFKDPTNLDSRFLRGRMRSRLFPFMEKEFGKSIRDPLVRLSQESKEFNDYFRNHWKTLFLDEKPWRNYLDCRTLTHPFEVRWAVREWLRRLKMDASSAVVETLVTILLSNKANRKVIIKDLEIAVDRGRLFLNPAYPIQPPIQVLSGPLQWGPWSINVDTHRGYQKERRGWPAAFEGYLTAFIPEGDQMQLGLYSELLSKIAKEKLQKKWGCAKMPAFFRKWVPIVAENGNLVCDFLSPGLQAKEKVGSRGLAIHLKLYLENPL